MRDYWHAWLERWYWKFYWWRDYRRRVRRGEAQRRSQDANNWRRNRPNGGRSWFK